LGGVEIAEGKYTPRGRAPLVTFENLSFRAVSGRVESVSVPNALKM
jgi:hypothetical protein